MRSAIAVALCFNVLLGCSKGIEPVGPPITKIEFGSIEGVVTLSDGGVAEGITVRLVRSTNDCMLCGWGTDTRTLVREVQADEAGEFRFMKVTTGKYFIYLGSYEGYSSGGPGDPPSFVVHPDRVTSVAYVLKRVDGQ